jgi:probable HAF family extracellular repeat protein
MSRSLSSLRRCLCVTLFIAPAAMAQEYMISQIPDLPGGYGIITGGISRTGQVAGTSILEVFFDVADPILYSNGATQDLGTPSGPRGYGYAFGNSINNLGQITGTNFDFLNTQAFLYSNGSITGIGSPPGGVVSYGNSINDSTQITGIFDTLEGYSHAFLYSNGIMTDLGVLPNGNNSYGQGINNIGQITGYGDAGNAEHAFIYQDGEFRDIGVLPGGTNSQGAAINDSGQVTGSSESATGTHAFLYSDGKMKDLGALPGTTESSGSALNNYGEVVGKSGGHAFLYTDGRLRDLNMLIPPNTGWVLQSAAGINDKGEIAVTATDISGEGSNFGLLLAPLHKNHHGHGDDDDMNRDTRDELERGDHGWRDEP